MPRVETWLNKKEYKVFRRLAEKEGLSDYQFLKQIILEKIKLKV